MSIEPINNSRMVNNVRDATNIFKLPKDILLTIFSLLSAKDILIAQLVTKSWKDLIKKNREKLPLLKIFVENTKKVNALSQLDLLQPKVIHCSHFSDQSTLLQVIDDELLFAAGKNLYQKQGEEGPFVMQQNIYAFKNVNRNLIALSSFENPLVLKIYFTEKKEPICEINLKNAGCSTTDCAYVDVLSNIAIVIILDGENSGRITLWKMVEGQGILLTAHTITNLFSQDINETLTLFLYENKILINKCFKKVDSSCIELLYFDLKTLNWDCLALPVAGSGFCSVSATSSRIILCCKLATSETTQCICYQSDRNNHLTVQWDFHLNSKLQQYQNHKIIYVDDEFTVLRFLHQNSKRSMIILNSQTGAIVNQFPIEPGTFLSNKSIILEPYLINWGFYFNILNIRTGKQIACKKFFGDSDCDLIFSQKKLYLYQNFSKNLLIFDLENAMDSKNTTIQNPAFNPTSSCSYRIITIALGIFASIFICGSLAALMVGAINLSIGLAVSSTLFSITFIITNQR